MTATLTITAKGQVTLRKEFLAHLGAKPGDRLTVNLLEGGRLLVEPKRGRPAALSTRAAILRHASAI